MGRFAPSTRETTKMLVEVNTSIYAKLTIIEVPSAVTAESELRKGDRRNSRVNTLKTPIATPRDTGVGAGTVGEVAIAARLRYMR